MEKGFWFRWQLLLGACLALACFSCRPAAPPVPRAPLPPPPSARPEQPPERPSFYVKVARLNLRAGPGMDFPKLGTLERNEEVEKVGEAENWYQVRVKRDGTLGWVSSQHLSNSGKLSHPDAGARNPGGAAGQKRDDDAPAPAAAACGGQTRAPAKTGPAAPEVTKPEEVEEPPPPPPPRRRKPDEETAPGPEGRAGKARSQTRGAASPAEASPAGP